jgi:hypothetical protein
MQESNTRTKLENERTIATVRKLILRPQQAQVLVYRLSHAPLSGSSYNQGAEWQKLVQRYAGFARAIRSMISSNKLRSRQFSSKMNRLHPSRLNFV